MTFDGMIDLHVTQPLVGGKFKLSGRWVLGRKTLNIASSVLMPEYSAFRFVPIRHPGQSTVGLS